MDYQQRYAAECARWYAVSGDASFKEKAYRALNWVTYTNDSSGKAVESPVSEGKDISNWWSNFGECPRMFYPAFAGIPSRRAATEPYSLFEFRSEKRLVCCWRN